LYAARYWKSNLLSVKYAECIFALLMFSSGIQASGTFVIADARSRSLALADAAITSDATGWSNPAALAFLKRPCISLLAENPWCISELASGAFSFCLPVKAGTFAVSFNRYGCQVFHESQAALSFGKSLGKKVKAGINLQYLDIKQYGDYGNLYAVIPSFGLQILPIPSLSLGLQVSNPARQGYIPRGFMKLPALIKAGLAYQPEPDILFCFEVFSESDNKPVYCGGIEYKVEKQFTFRIGVSSSRGTQYNLGIGYQGKHLGTDIAVSHHPVLGFSPSVTVTCIL
jgi:hypothetical protein